MRITFIFLQRKFDRYRSVRFSFERKVNDMDIIQEWIEKLKTLEDRPAELIIDHIQNGAWDMVNNAIWEWYASYSPRKYERTYNFASVGATTEVFGRGCSIGLRINTDIMSDYAYDSAETVYTWIMNFGIHGHPTKAPSTTPVLDLISKNFADIVTDSLAEILLD